MDPILRLKMSVEQSARSLIYAMDNHPGNDLGANATAVCWLELRQAMSDLNKVYKNLVPTFDNDSVARETLKQLEEKFKV